MRPGTNVTTLTAPPPTTLPVNTGTWFVAGITSQGPTAAELVTSFQQFTNVFGSRGSSPQFTDAAETYFKEGGARMYVARVVGPAATAANVLLLDGTSAPSLKVFAIGPGAYATGYKIIVATVTGGYTIQVTDSNNNVLETSNTLVTNADAVGYGQTSQYLTIISAGSGVPAVGSFTLAGGADDIIHVTDSSYTGALALFTSSLGPGQVSIPGQTDTAIVTALGAHALANNRIALVDMTDVNTSLQSSSACAATLLAAATTTTALGSAGGNRQIAMCAPWVDIAPFPGTYSLRPVPPSAFFAARCAVIDSNIDPKTGLGNPNIPAAGANGILSTVSDLHAVFADTDRATLNLAGVNVIKPVFNSFRIYGFRTAANWISDPNYWQLANARLDMAIIAQAQVLQENFVFAQLDGAGLTLARYGNALNAMLQSYYTMGALYSTDGTPSTAYTVDSGSDLNTPSTESLGELIATIACRRSPMGELVQLNIVRVGITQNV